MKSGTPLMIPVKGIIRTVFNASANHEPTYMNNTAVNTVVNATVLIISSGPNKPSVRLFQADHGYECTWPKIDTTHIRNRTTKQHRSLEAIVMPKGFLFSVP